MYADKWLWPIFGCNVGQSVQIGMKLELDVWHQPLDVYAKFQTDISKHVQNKSSVKRLNTLGHLDQYMAQHGRIVKQSYCETVLVTILFNSN